LALLAVPPLIFFGIAGYDRAGSHAAGAAQVIGRTLGSLLLLLLGCLAAPGAAHASCDGERAEKFRIMLDVGHSPNEPGAISARGVTEYHFNLALVVRIGEEFQAAGFHSVRQLKIATGGLEGLLERPKQANAWPADLLLSIHHDSVQPKYLKPWTHDGRARRYADEFRGFSIFVSQDNPAFQASLRFATSLADRLIASAMTFTTHHAEDIDGERRELLDAARGVYRYDELTVLRLARMPAVLLEAGVIVNRDEELVLATPERRAAIAKAVTAAVAEFCAARSAR
jgi:N-acetylmuramoyl-L-alanine amidase